MGGRHTSHQKWVYPTPIADGRAGYLWALAEGLEADQTLPQGYLRVARRRAGAGRVPSAQ